MPPLALAFVVATVLWTIASLHLSLRQSAHVRAHSDAVPADFTKTITPGEHRKAAEYTLARERVARFELLADAILAVVWALGGIALLYGFVASLMAPSIWRGVAFFVGTGIIGTLISLPFSIYRTFAIEQAFGFNRTTPGAYIVDKLKGWAISLAVAVPLLAVLLWVMRAATGLWWLWAWFGLLALMVAAPTVYVRLIAPRFNQFSPLTDPTLRQPIERVLEDAGYRASGLYTMDASRRSSHGNAFFIGFGRTKRIVLFDTLIERCRPEEVAAVVAHELGHFKHKHVVFGLVRAAVMSFTALAVFGWLAKQPWLLPSFGVHREDPALSLFVCLLLGSIVGPVAAVAGNWISRRNEYQADDYARRAVGVEPMVSALTGLARDNASTLTPDPLYSLVHHSHPTVPQRVRQLRAMAAGASDPLAAEPTYA